MATGKGVHQQSAGHCSLLARRCSLWQLRCRVLVCALQESQLAHCKTQLEISNREYQYVKDQLTTTEVRSSKVCSNSSSIKGLSKRQVVASIHWQALPSRADPMHPLERSSNLPKSCMQVSIARVHNVDVARRRMAVA